LPIKAIAMDVDGVLTDGTVWLDETGGEIKRIAFADIMGVSIGRRAGLLFALVSGEGGPSLDRIAEKFAIDEIYRDCKDKAGAVRDFAAQHGLDLADVCFIGDDINDVPALQICGLAVAPASAQAEASAVASMVTSRPAGHGAVREAIDSLLADRTPEAIPSPRQQRP
jgi:3-deoxy-D-manno-octulosonate 8-phosphate phosphatase (KDO 8-P phosphatase)